MNTTIKRGAIGDGLLAARISDVFTSNASVFGSRNVHSELAKLGIRVSRKRVIRIMKRNQQRGACAERKQVTPQSFAPRLVKRGTFPRAVNQVWVGDITYVPTSEGWLYVAAKIDLHSRYLVGWAVSEIQDTKLSLAALSLARRRRKPRAGLIVHTDRGVQYSAKLYQDEITRRGLIASMSRTGNCHDNASAESFFSTLKRELGGKRALKKEPLAIVRSKVVRYLSGVYNQRRPHSTLGYHTPEAFERLSASERGKILARARRLARERSAKRAAKRAEKLAAERREARRARKPKPR